MKGSGNVSPGFAYAGWGDPSSGLTTSPPPELWTISRAGLAPLSESRHGRWRLLPGFWTFQPPSSARDDLDVGVAHERLLVDQRDYLCVGPALRQIQGACGARTSHRAAEGTLVSRVGRSNGCSQMQTSASSAVAIWATVPASAPSART
jgi:hypothetical protein